MEEERLWGTKHIQRTGTFRGRIVRATWKRGKPFGDKPGREQLVLEIQPTSYEGNLRFGFYPYSLNEKSKWARLQEALENCGLTPESEKDLVGLEFEWHTIDIEYGTDSEGNQIIAKNVLLPIRLIKEKD